MKSPPPLNRKSHTGRIKWVLEYEVITPMMGGGAKTRESDPITTVRATSVLGQLRFWWRACRAGDFSDLRQLRAAEDALWGTMSSPSKVELGLECIKPGTLLEGVDEKNAPSYVAFPLQGDFKKGIPPGKVRKDIQFRLKLSFPTGYEGDVEAALWAWTHFGGIGARTRRGFGALRLQKGGSFKNWSGTSNDLELCWKRYVSNGKADGIKHVPRLPSAFQDNVVALSKTPKSPEVIWKGSINAYKAIRQKRRPGHGKPGRSYWPEPDTIRQLTGKCAPTHKTKVSSFEGFPRAYYGLPIVFQFKDPGEPPIHTLQTTDFGRRASPLILKPVAINSDKCLALAVVLVPYCLPPSALILRGEPHKISKFELWDKLAKDLEVPTFYSGGPFLPILDAIRSL